MEVLIKAQCSTSTTDFHYTCTSNYPWPMTSAIITIVPALYSTRTSQSMQELVTNKKEKERPFSFSLLHWGALGEFFFLWMWKHWPREVYHNDGYCYDATFSCRHNLSMHVPLALSPSAVGAGGESEQQYSEGIVCPDTGGGWISPRWRRMRSIKSTRKTYGFFKKLCEISSCWLWGIFKKIFFSIMYVSEVVAGHCQSTAFGNLYSSKPR